MTKQEKIDTQEARAMAALDRAIERGGFNERSAYGEDKGPVKARAEG